MLNNKSYSYLPKVALNYIKKIYENTGELVFTEKNKQTGLPYLNPNFITYLTMSKDEQSKVDIITDTYVTDYCECNYGVLFYKKKKRNDLIIYWCQPVSFFSCLIFISIIYLEWG